MWLPHSWQNSPALRLDPRSTIFRLSRPPHLPSYHLRSQCPPPEAPPSSVASTRSSSSDTNRRPSHTPVAPSMREQNRKKKAVCYGNHCVSHRLPCGRKHKLTRFTKIVAPVQSRAKLGAVKHPSCSSFLTYSLLYEGTRDPFTAYL